MTAEKKPGLFCGIATDLSPKLHILFWVLLALVEASLCFSQFGIMSYGDQVAGDVNFVFMLVPVAMTALALGFVPGAVLSLEAGLLLMIRSDMAPISYFDMTLYDPVLSALPLSVGGILFSAIIILASRRWPSRTDANRHPLTRMRAAKVIFVVIASLVYAASFAYGTRGAFYVFIDPDHLNSGAVYLSDNFYLVAETLLNTAIVAFVCIVSEIADVNRRCGDWEPSMRSVFHRWLLLVLAVVFMVASAASFYLETERCSASMVEALENELDYLEVQVKDRNERLDSIKTMSSRSFLEKSLAAAELVAADSSTLNSQERLASLANMLGLEAIAVTDKNGVVVADSEFGSDALGYSFASQDSTKPYMKLVKGKGHIVEEPRASIDPDGTVSDKMRVFCGVPRVDEPGIVQTASSADEYQQMLSAASIEHLTDDYTVQNSGSVLVVHDNQVVSCNNPDDVGKSLADVLGASPDDVEELVESALDPVVYASGNETITYAVQARHAGDYVLMALMPVPEIYKERTSALLYNAGLFLALFAVIFVVAAGLLSRVVEAPIKRTNETLAKITAGDLSGRVSERNVTEFASLSKGINTTVDALKGYIAEAERKNAQELTTAKAIQESSLPTEFPAFPDIDKFDIYASMKTAKEVGGDFYDFFLVEATGKLAFIVADVSGKGIPAALFMMAAKTQTRSCLEAGMTVGEAMGAVNHQLCLNNDEGMFVTALACVLDYETGELSYVNAGHNPPLLHRADEPGKWSWLRTRSGLPLGLFDGLPYEQFSLELKPGDFLYLYTDGVTEATNANEELFGDERLEETMRAYEGYNPRSACVGVRRAITDFTLDAEQSDDITMLGLKYGVPPERNAVMVLPARADQLIHVCNYIHGELHRRHAPKSVQNSIDIAAEELFVNVCHYAYPEATPENPGEVRVSFEYEPNPPALIVQISDDGVPYNPMEKPDAVTPDDIMAVPIGGLGILMAKRSVDDMSYERVGESNVLSFKKSW